MAFSKFTVFLTLACSFSAILAAPIPQTTNTADNLQPFTGALGGTAPPAVVRGDDGFTVEGKGTFTDIASALAASCDVLKTQCTNAANSADGRASGLTLAQCEQQDAECRAAIAGVSDPDASPPIVETAAKTSPSTTLRGKNVRRAPAGGNVQPFTGALAGQAPPAVTPGGLGFQVAGGDSFADLASALSRSCDIQKQDCLNANVPAAQCDQQANQCRAAIASKQPRSELAPPPPPPKEVPPPPPAPVASRPRSDEALEKRQGQPGRPPNTNVPPPPQQGNRNPPPPPAGNRPRSEEILESRQRQPLPPPQGDRIPPPPPSAPPRGPRSEEAFEKRQGPGQPGGRPDTNAPPPPQNGGNRNDNNNAPPPPPPNNGNNNNNQPPPPNGDRQPRNEA